MQSTLVFDLPQPKWYLESYISISTLPLDEAIKAVSCVIAVKASNNILFITLQALVARSPPLFLLNTDNILENKGC